MNTYLSQRIKRLSRIRRICNACRFTFRCKKPLKITISKEMKAHFEELFSENIEIFEDSNTGELYSKITDLKTGNTEIKKKDPSNLPKSLAGVQGCYVPVARVQHRPK